jgi:hypothetical protein
MNYELLLSWVSERGQGSLTSFRRAHDWLAPNAGAAERYWTWSLQSLQSLGHIEVSWQERRWEAAPSTIATTVNGGGYAFLCGARTRWLLRRIDSLDSDPALRHVAQSIVLERPVSQDAGPDLQLLTLDSDHDIEVLCDALGVRYAPQAADRLLAALPRLSAILLAGRKKELPGGVFPVRMGEGLPGQPLFSDVVEDLSPPPGGYCTRLYDVSRYFYVHSDGAVFEASRGEVIYAELRRLGRQVLRWSEAESALLVPARMRLPELYERAAVLRTGLLPVVERTPSDGPALYLKYRNIDLAFAQYLGQGLDQGVQLASDCSAEQLASTWRGRIAPFAGPTNSRLSRQSFAR